MVRAREFLSYLFFIPVAYTIKVLLERVGRYEVEDWAATRAEYERIVEDAERDARPILFCANHLTFIDSIIIFWIFNPVWRYVLKYDRIFWNVPAGDVFAKIWYLHWLFRLNKCVFIYRDESAAHKTKVMQQLRSILEAGSSLLLFPEGRRSRSGRVETAKLTTGAARLALSYPEAKLVCVYSRADRQAAFSNYPPRRSRFSLQLEEIEVAPFLALPEREGQIALTQAIGARLAHMEERHFSFGLSGRGLTFQEHMERGERKQIGEESHGESHREKDRHV